MISVPTFPLIVEPGDLDDLTLTAETVFLEGEAEPDEGKLAIAYSVRNRMDRGVSAKVAILGKDQVAYGDGVAYEVYSCWNDDYQHRARARLSGAQGESLAASWRAAASALWKLVVDPTDGCTHYLNVEVTKRIRKGGTLPDWAQKVLDAGGGIVIGKHTFMAVA